MVVLLLRTLTDHRQTLEQVDYTVLAATSVLGDLIDKCPPAEACRDAFERMSKATVQMCLSTTGFGARPAHLGPPKLTQTQTTGSIRDVQPVYIQTPNEQGYFRPQRPRPQFDMNLRDLFPEEKPENRSFARNIGTWQSPLPSQSSASTQQGNLFPNHMQQTSSRPALTPTFRTPSYGAPSSVNNDSLLSNSAVPFDNFGFINDIDSLLADTTAT
ncbi:MAG: hypothetical protein Q9187_002942, partial [Circinaria calcarea]